MGQLTRRHFLKTSIAAGATFAISGTKSSGNVLGSNDRIRVAVAGINGRGTSHIDGFAKMQNVEVAYLVDPDTRLYDSRMKRVADIQGKSPQPITDIRQVLDDDSIQVVSIATPNHWHSLMAIWACQAGKDVYVEKPLSHNVHEGRVLVEAARKHDRIVQHGTQSRSDGRWNRIAEVINGGHFGPLKVARGVCYKRRDSIGVKQPASPPDELDFNLWLGPAAEQPFHANLVHYNWHWFWDFGNGDIGNQGVHQMDIARWGIPGATLPKSVVCVGGRFGYEDQGETANTQVAVFDYGDTQLIFEVRGLVPKNHITDLFHFEDGTIKEDGKFYRNGSSTGEPLPEVADTRGPGGSNHFGNFIEAVRNRNRSYLNAEVEDGHYSSALCHLANVSYRLGKDVPFDGGKKVFEGNAAAEETFESMTEHLARENRIELAGETFRRGRFLEFDAKSESFVNDKEANQFLFRNYRAPFVVPETLT
ncbi:MAG TPA: Gfo/Idh/MocA family oxidoreductase [Planctomycetaceae bacterium]|nr:Gfo/Idh/MocA family oxidoreductase [Planctomycetaceae bacterium]